MEHFHLQRISLRCWPLIALPIIFIHSALLWFICSLAHHPSVTPAGHSISLSASATVLVIILLVSSARVLATGGLYVSVSLATMHLMTCPKVLVAVIFQEEVRAKQFLYRDRAYMYAIDVRRNVARPAVACSPMLSIDLRKFQFIHIFHVYLAIHQVPRWHHILYNILDSRVGDPESLVEIVRMSECRRPGVCKSLSVISITSRPWLAWQGVNEQLNLDIIDLVPYLISAVSNVYNLMLQHNRMLIVHSVLTIVCIIAC